MNIANLGAILTCKQIQEIINRHRIQQKIRILWPDFEVYDLLEQKINLEDIRFFTSNCIRIITIDNLTQQLQQIFSQKALTHLAIHKIIQFDRQMQLVHTFYAILSKRGIAIDQLNCKFCRGFYTIFAHIAQIDRQVSLWGVESVTDQIKLVGPRSIFKKNSMWTLQFESSKPLKSIIFYSTKRQPRYGKNAFIQTQLPKTTKLQYCMKNRLCSSYMDSLMSKEEVLISDTYYLSNSHKIIKFGKDKKQNQEEGNHSLPKIKMHEDADIKISDNPPKRQQQTMVKILSNSSFLQILQTNECCEINGILQEIKVYINKVESTMHQLIQNDNKIDKKARETIVDITFAEMQSYSWNQITDLINLAKQSQVKQLLYFLLAVRVFVFLQDRAKSIFNWTAIYESSLAISESQLKLKFFKWGKKIMVQYCQELLNKCDDQDYEQLAKYKQLLIDCITQSLKENHNQTAKRSDLLSILMQIHNKKDIFDLYHTYRLPTHSLLLTSSIRTWQQNQHFYPQPNSDVIYQTQNLPSIIQYTHPESSSNNSYKNDEQIDFSIKFCAQLNSNNAFISGKPFTFKNMNLKYFLFRKEEIIYCFIEQVHPFSEPIVQTQFTTFYMQLQMTINSNIIKKQQAWSFISPSIAVGSKFLFRQIPKCINIECKITFKRNIIHDSILNYLRIQFQELVRLKNKCSVKIEEESGKLIKRRSSYFLEKDLLTASFNAKIERQCFLHKICPKCQSLSGEASIFHLDPSDFYNLLLFAPFKQQIDSLLITLKYLIINKSWIQNKNFWMSHIRIKYLNLSSLLKLINTTPIAKENQQILSSLIDQKLKYNILSENKTDRNLIFLMVNECRIGLTMWQYYEQDYSQDYLIYLTNNKSIV